MPEFSIITPSYRQLHWLRLCAASVSDQAGIDAEHIIQDGGSGPDVTAWAAQWTASHLATKFFEEKDKGMYDAINRGFRRAKGDILAWLNCDEQYLPATLEKVSGFFRANPGVDVLFGDALLIDGSGRLLSYRRAIPPGLLHIRLSHLNTLSCATFVRRSVIDRGLMLEDRWRVIADGVWVGDMLKVGLPMALLREPLAAFTVLEGNLGQTDLGRDEHLRWRDETVHGWRRLALARWAVIAWHRVRKLSGGAYRKRDVTTELYTLDSPAKRKRVEARGLSFFWQRAEKQSGR